MRLLSELLPVLAPGLRQLYCESCKLGDEGVLALAEVVPQLPHLKYLDVMDNAFTGTGARGLRRAWQAARKPGVRLPTVRDGYGLLLSSMDILFINCSWLWHCLPMFKTYKAVQRARAWPLEGLPAMAAEGRTKTVVELVQKYGANPNTTDQKTGGTALHAAARSGHTATVEALVQTFGAKPKLTDKRGMTALALACLEGHEVVAEKLVAPTHAAGALELQGRSGCYALLFAETRGLTSVVDKLHECGSLSRVDPTSCSGAAT
jgi:hypothetical protein